MTSYERLDREPVVLPLLGGALAVVWHGLAELTDAAGSLRWTVVGGQMVLLHGLENGEVPHRVSNDIDTAVDVRSDRDGISRMVAVLTRLGYRSAGTSPEGRAYRFEKSVGDGEVATVDVAVDDDSAGGDKLTVDVLVPEGLSERAKTRTVGSGTAFPAAGVTQALRRTELVPVSLDGQLLWVPRPNLLGALVAKATAASADHQDPERHLRDVAFLCALIGDPLALAEEVDTTDRRRLRRVATRLPPDSPLWRGRSDAHAALDLLVGDL